MKRQDLVDWTEYESTHDYIKAPDGIWYLIPKDIWLDDTPDKKFPCLMITDKGIFKPPHQLTKAELGIESSHRRDIEEEPPEEEPM